MELVEAIQNFTQGIGQILILVFSVAVGTVFFGILWAEWRETRRQRARNWKV